MRMKRNLQGAFLEIEDVDVVDELINKLIKVYDTFLLITEYMLNKY